MKNNHHHLLPLLGLRHYYFPELSIFVRECVSCTGVTDRLRTDIETWLLLLVGRSVWLPGKRDVSGHWDWVVYLLNPFPETSVYVDCPCPRC